MSEWKEVRLGDVCENVSRTFNFKNKQKVIFINTGDVLNNKFLHFNYSNKDMLPGQAKKAIENDDILFSEIRPKNKRFVYVNLINPSDFVVSTKFMVLKSNKKLLIPKYLYLLITSNEYLNKFQQIAESRSGTFPQITFSSISNLTIHLPPLPTQKKIADILSVIDEKIETLQNINSTLENMAKAIFKSWFVDFDITKAKASGKSDDEIAKEFGINKEIVQLFPSEFETSETGEIPKGWEVVPFLDVVKLDTTSIKPFNFPQRIWKHYSIPAYDNNHYPIFEKGNNIKSNKYKVNSNAILVSKLNPNTERIWLPNINNDDFAICSTEFMQFIPYKKDYRFFIYLNILSDNFQSMLKSKVTGTTGSRQRVKPSQVLEIEIILPAFKLVKIFNKNIYPLLRMRLDNQEQIQTLQQIRDTLLPKLINKEIEVDELDIRGIE